MRLDNAHACFLNCEIIVQYKRLGDLCLVKTSHLLKCREVYIISVASDSILKCRWTLQRGGPCSVAEVSFPSPSGDLAEGWPMFSCRGKLSPPLW